MVNYYRREVVKAIGTCTLVLYEFENSIGGVSAIFCTTTQLSKEAELVAKRLGIAIRYENLKKYPMVKCNINLSNKEKIYHLPFDQQYDNIIIGNKSGEQYLEQIAHAETLGFRRAFKWTGN